jgi:hypothetical protein
MAEVGRPPMFKTPEELQDLIDDYFEKGVTTKKVVIGKAPKNYTIEVEVPTITGLTHYLGFESRQSFYTYEKKEEFSYTIKRARLFIEKHYEEMLQTGNTTGAIFALKNFDWKDKQEVEQSGGITIKFENPGDYIYPSQDQSDSGIPESV